MTGRTDIHLLLRQATDATHQRLHLHEGLGAVAAGTIERGDYAALLRRLLGFHRPFDAMIEVADAKFDFRIDLVGRRRAEAIERDLITLGVDARTIRATPSCPDVSLPESKAAFMGALYVVEGSTLGGVQLARALDPVLGKDSRDGRAFFSGYGKRNGAMWKEFLAELDACATCDERRIPEIIEGATRTFATFEKWMQGWREVGATPTAASSIDAPHLAPIRIATA